MCALQSGALQIMAPRYSVYTHLLFEYPQERILKITINRPERYNALDEVGHKELTYVWREVDDDPDIDVVILTGAGKAFSAGGDFEMVEKTNRGLHRASNHLEGSSRPGLQPH